MPARFGSAFALAVLTLVSPPPPALAATASRPPVTILHNDRTVAGLRPIILSGRVLVALGPAGTTLPAQLPNAGDGNPAQALFSRLRATLVYDAGARTATVMSARLYPSTETHSASATAGLARFALTTETFTNAGVRTSSTTSSRRLLVSPRVVDGILYVPLRAFAEAAGAYVAWDAAHRAVVLRTLPPSPQELAAEAEARARIEAIGKNARQSLENAARNLR